MASVHDPVKPEWLLRLARVDFDLQLQPPATRAEIAAAEARLGVRFPDALSTFFEMTNGILDEWGYAYAWPLEQLVEENLLARADAQMPLPQGLLGIGGNGAGDWFCVDLSDDNAGRVVFHYWISSETTPVAADVLTFWPRWFAGSTTV